MNAAPQSLPEWTKDVPSRGHSLATIIYALRIQDRFVQLLMRPMPTGTLHGVPAQARAKMLGVEAQTIARIIRQCVGAAA